MPTTEELTQTEILKQYLLEKENAYLLDDNNNGKTIMLSGAWGSGKTHFWQREIEPELKNKLNEKACVYVSLYGKDNLDSLKKEILINASSIDNLLSKEVSSFGFDVLSSIKDSDMKIGQLFKAFSDATDSGKSSQGIEQLKNGGIICFDDFERKSDKINLNDLFGFISQLSIDLKCKTIIILNSEVFKGKEADTFTNVKEKIISKFFYFNPTFKELFNAISSSPKYDELADYKTNILSIIKQTEELNARIYTQVLDNCLEWLQVKGTMDNNIIRVLVLSTFNFIINHTLFKYVIPIEDDEVLEYDYPEINFSNKALNKIFSTVTKEALDKDYLHYAYPTIYLDEEYFIKFLIEKNVTPEYIEKNKIKIKSLWKYGYHHYYVGYVNESIYNEISNFIKSGILLP